MPRRSDFFRQISQDQRFPQEAFPGIPVVELAGNRRVLIEGHQGVTEYGCEQIQVKMRYGCLRICGCNLALAHMSKERLVVTGRIHQLCLCQEDGR